jgi:hypothetical protein
MNACQIWNRRHRETPFPVYHLHRTRQSDFGFTVLPRHCVPSMRASCGKVTCYVTSKLWGKCALCGSFKSCQLELAYSLGPTPSVKGFLSQCIASYIQISVFSREENEHPPIPPHLPSNCLPPLLPFITCILAIVPRVCTLSLLLLLTEGGM